ncbi:MAG: hypothetical protein A3C35_07710 [Omnitrophica bacterium RIFCSPHIGHO2_02_FULL_46_11]|nr:MAG: hypothetical protein A3C35_07710 [Omnitrophica bacterium RIFCSPHIGHO2_02_FULL_46_11]
MRNATARPKKSGKSLVSIFQSIVTRAKKELASFEKNFVKLWEVLAVKEQKNKNGGHTLRLILSIGSEDRLALN